MRTIVLGLVAMLLLAGCATESDPEPTDSTGGADEPGSADEGDQNESPSDTSEPGEPSDPADPSEPSEPADPSGGGTIAYLTAPALNGTVPFNVTFELDGDVDGDELTWVLTVAGEMVAEGTELPASHTQDFTTAGNHSVNLTVTDSEDASASAVLVVEALPADVGPTEPTAQPVDFDGGVLFADPWAIALDGCLLDAGARDAGLPRGITGTDHALDRAFDGWSYNFNVGGVIAEFWSENPVALLGSGPSGQVPPTADYVVVCINDPTAVDVTYTLTMTPP